MKIIIEHGNTKREIDGAFNLCGSKEDLIELAQSIIKQTKPQRRFVYGWIKIKNLSTEQSSIANTKPKGWDE